MSTPEQLTPPCRAFLADLETLCTLHQVYITPSGYDMLQIWRRRSDDPRGFDWDGIEDCTTPDGATL